jgi:hypothetical protein
VVMLLGIWDDVREWGSKSFKLESLLQGWYGLLYWLIFKSIHRLHIINMIKMRKIGLTGITLLLYNIPILWLPLIRWLFNFPIPTDIIFVYCFLIYRTIMSTFISFSKAFSGTFSIIQLKLLDEFSYGGCPIKHRFFLEFTLIGL